MDTTHLSQSNDSQPNSDHPIAILTGLSVMLVEDCADQGRLYLKFLQQEGANVTLECNGRAAVDSINKAPHSFDAVVMDYKMPEMCGLESTIQIRELGFSGAIIAITASDSEELERMWTQAGCNEYLKKPLGKMDLISAIVRYTAVATGVERTHG